MEEEKSSNKIEETTAKDQKVQGNVIVEPSKETWFQKSAKIRLFGILSAILSLLGTIIITAVSGTVIFLFTNAVFNFSSDLAGIGFFGNWINQLTLGVSGLFGFFIWAVVILSMLLVDGLFVLAFVFGILVTKNEFKFMKQIPESVSHNGKLIASLVLSILLIPALIFFANVLPQFNVNVFSIPASLLCFISLGIFSVTAVLILVDLIIARVKFSKLSPEQRQEIKSESWQRFKTKIKKQRHKRDNFGRLY